MRSQFPGVGGCCPLTRKPVPDAHAKTLKGVLAWASVTETTTSTCPVPGPRVSFGKMVRTAVEYDHLYNFLQLHRYPAECSKNT